MLPHRAPQGKVYAGFLFAKIALIIAVALGLAPALFGQVEMYVAYPPFKPHQPYYQDVQTYLANNPVVSGAVFALEWGKVDQGAGQYDWNAIDSEIQPWITAGKKVSLAVWAVSDTAINTSTPQYVWTNLGSANITTCQGLKVPNFFASAFQVAYKQFMVQVIQHYGNNASIGYIRFGLGHGAATGMPPGYNTDPTCEVAFSRWGWSVSTWLNYVKAMVTYEGTLNSPKQLMLGIASLSPGLGAEEAAAAVPEHIGFGTQGLQASDLSNYPHCTDDWCDLFGQYTGQVPLELQTISLSSPQGYPPTGSLVELVPFTVQNSVSILEILCDDWLLAYDPNYPGHGTYGAAYATVLAAAANSQ